MKKYSLILMTFVMVLMFTVACGTKDDNELNDNAANETSELTYTPEEIDPEVDVCEICAMAVADDQYATQIILKNERALKFDDLGCLFAWVEENGDDEIGAKFVRDYHTEEWILLEDATFIYDEEIETPMAYGVISFKDRTDAENHLEENNHGEIVTNLQDHKWDMMDHDHDHGYDHDHGAHSSGLEIKITELDKVSAGAEVALEVKLLLGEEVFTDGKVRYEIWEEDNKETTDWIDANESEAGTYVVNYNFKELATYQVQIHIEDDADLHDHVEYEITVGE